MISQGLLTTVHGAPAIQQQTVIEYEHNAIGVPIYPMLVGYLDWNVAGPRGRASRTTVLLGISVSLSLFERSCTRLRRSQFVHRDFGIFIIHRA